MHSPKPYRNNDLTASLIVRWVNFVKRYPLMVILSTAFLTSGVLFYTISHFKINTDFKALISDDTPFRKIKKDYDKAFPQFTNTLVVVIDADTPELAMLVHDQMTNRLKQQEGIFKTVYQPGGGDFFKKNGLLYKGTDELEDLADDLADVQPFLAMISDDLSLRGLFSVLIDAMTQDDDSDVREVRLGLVFDRMSEAIQHVLEERPFQLSWQEIMLNKQASQLDLRKFIILQPFTGSRGISKIKEAIYTLKSISKELGLDRAHGVRVRISGPAALNYENLLTVRKSAGIASLVSLILVGITLYIGLGSTRLVFASLTTLIAGLIWTTGFAIAFIGHLNLVSITFAVLFIGLGIDYSIQLCLRYQEIIESGLSNSDAISDSARGVGKSILICTVTTAIGFYAFVPTAYAGVSELGLISGTGMFLCFFANLTVLPAVMSLIPLKKVRPLPLSLGSTFSTLTQKYARAITASALILGLVAAFLLPKVFFNYNPLSLYDPAAESVSTAQELFENAETSPWTASVLAGNAEEASKLDESASKMKEVEMALTLADFVPGEQLEKLEIISDIALIMPEIPEDMSIRALGYDEMVEAVDKFEVALKRLSDTNNKGTYYSSGRNLYRIIRQFKKVLQNDPAQGERTLKMLERGLLSHLPLLLDRLETSLEAEEFDESDLPEEVSMRSVSHDKRHRVQIFPSENITDINALKRFVAAVRSVAPDATDTPVVILEAGKTIVSSFKQASLSALIVISIFLLMIMKSIHGTGLILIPLILSVLLTAAATVLLDIPFNYANVIVIPLLLGIGVDNGIHLIHRFRTEPPSDGNMLKTSTSRAVLFSSLTTIMSFSSLSFSSHRGIASMGKLLTLCMMFLIINTLILLPAMLKLYSGSKGEKDN